MAYSNPNLLIPIETYTKTIDNEPAYYAQLQGRPETLEKTSSPQESLSGLMIAQAIVQLIEIEPPEE